MSSSSSPTHASIGSRRRLLTGRSLSRRRAAKDPHEARVDSFRSAVWGYWKKSGRHELPWRKTKDPYRILVSEVMLQQTQVPRVIDKYKSFLKKFPTVRALARAPLVDVLSEWNGLGYNRRAKYLNDAAKMITATYRGNLRAALAHPLPGIGPYTKSAVRVFAFNEPDALLETNIRSAFILHFHRGQSSVEDKEILPMVREAARGQDPRRWHSALMDYGAHIKKLHQNPSRKSAHYVVQSKFEGSRRQVRGAILKTLSLGPRGDLALAQELSFDARRVREALSGLLKDGLVSAKKGSWKIA
ncbi:MAG: A/G-specific adenine glycosylase [Candidatus Kaiserbacteria bacterium]|nr:MAG: A/G-specific adenine glycosylase [Candidatus Kaiserbacteria bacterium]